MIKIFNIRIFLFLFLFPSFSCWAGEINYYAPNGSIITKDEYDKLCKKNSKKLEKIRNAMKEAKNEALQKQTDKYGRPLYDSQGRRISYWLIDSEKENKQKRKYKYRTYSQQPVQRYRAYPHQSIQRKDKKTLSESDYRNEMLRIEREKLRLLKFRDFKEDMKYLRDRRTQRSQSFRDWNTQSLRDKMQLDEIERNTRAIKRKLDWGW